MVCLSPGATGIDYAATEVGSYTVVVTENSCSSTSSDPVTFSSGAPTIAIATTASTCFNSTVPQDISLTYSGTTFVPITYRIVSATGFLVKGITSLPLSEIPITIPANTTPGDYLGTLYVENGVGCDSDPINFTITVKPSTGCFL